MKMKKFSNYLSPLVLCTFGVCTSNVLLFSVGLVLFQITARLDKLEEKIKNNDPWCY